LYVMYCAIIQMYREYV